MRWPVQSPFRTRPGLARRPQTESAAGSPTPDALAAVYAELRRPRLSQAMVGEPDPWVLKRLHHALRTPGMAPVRTDAETLALALQDDVVVLHDEADADGQGRFCLRFLSVAFRSNWHPAEKLGFGFAAIHAPVADNALIPKGAEGIRDLAFSRSMWRTPRKRRPE